MGRAAPLVGMIAVAAIIGYVMWGAGSGDGEPGGVIGKSLTSKKRAQIKLWQTELNRKIQAHKTVHGGLPATLEEIKNVRNLPDGWSWRYDASTGKASIDSGAK